MTPINPSAAEANGLGALAEELRQESERLGQLAARLKAREEELAEMVANYPYFKRFVYERLKEEMLRDQPEWPPDVDLEKWAREHEAQPLENFIDEIEEICRGVDQ